jgi:hypothetical protein
MKVNIMRYRSIFGYHHKNNGNYWITPFPKIKTMEAVDCVQFVAWIYSLGYLKTYNLSPIPNSQLVHYKLITN